MYSGYSNEKILKLLSLRKLLSVVKVGGTEEYGQFFSKIDPKNVHINQDIVSGIDTAGYRSRALKIVENVNGTSFFAGMTVLHELVHYMRHWNGLPSLVNRMEAGREFEGRVFGQVLSIKDSSKISVIYDWKF